MKALSFDASPLRGKRLLLAHSGGVDSSVLAHLLLQADLDFSVAHCNFQLRGAESDQDASFVKNWCQQHQIPFFEMTFSTIAYQQFTKKSTQLVARDLRYKWFESLQLCHDFEILLTAHHLNDQIETFLIHASRGTGIGGLLGIPEKRNLVRPLLAVTKEKIIEYAQSQSIKWREDHTNSEPTYLRNRIRKEVLAPLEKINPKSIEQFQTTFTHLESAHTFIEKALLHFKATVFEQRDHGQWIQLRSLESLPDAAFCLYHWLAPLGFDVKEVLKLIQTGSGKKLVSNNYRLIRERDYLVLTTRPPSGESTYTLDWNSCSLKVPVSLQWKSIALEGNSVWKSHQAVLDIDLLKKKLYLRKYQKGDYFCPTGMKGKKLLSKYFKDEKYSLLEKEQQWLLCCKDQIIWVIGKRCDRRFVAPKDAPSALLIEMI